MTCPGAGSSTSTSPPGSPWRQWPRLHLPRPAGSGRVDITGGLLAAVLTTALLLGATWGGSRYGWTSAPVLARIIISVLSLGAYLTIERRAAEPITPLHLFRNPILTIASAQFLLATMVLFVAMLYVPLFLQTVQHRSAFTAGLFDIPLLVGLVLAAALAGPRIARTSRYKFYPVIGAILTGTSMWILSLAGQRTGAPAPRRPGHYRAGHYRAAGPGWRGHRVLRPGRAARRAKRRRAQVARRGHSIPVDHA